jgi:hypothetical protein
VTAPGETTRALAKEIEDDYSQYRAVAPIRSEDGALYYNVGDRVPASNVKLHGYDERGLVAKTSTKAAAVAAEAAPGEIKK